jgi:hypothetical protein
MDINTDAIFWLEEIRETRENCILRSLRVRRLVAVMGAMRKILVR